MLVIPAIDVKDGRCVRLYQGDYRRMTVYDEHPAAVAARFQAAGARLIHLVDLDGAATGRPTNLAAIRDVVGEVTIPVELGGGIRSLETVEACLRMGVGRVILGTAAVEDRDLVARAAHAFGEQVVVGIDARDGLVATHGWQRTSEVRALDLARDLAELGVRRFIYTDIHQRRHAHRARLRLDARAGRRAAGPGDRLGRREPSRAPPEAPDDRRRGRDRRPRALRRDAGPSGRDRGARARALRGRRICSPSGSSPAWT